LIKVYAAAIDLNYDGEAFEIAGLKTDQFSVTSRNKL
jgi:hypothetical protein